MTRKTKNDRAVNTFLTRELAKKREDLAATEKSLAELQQLQAEYDEIEREMTKRVNRCWPNTKGGRPGKWKGELGYELVVGIRGIQAANNNCSVAEAIRILKKQEPEKWAKYKVYQEGHNELESKYQRAKKYWLPLIERLERADARSAELKAKETKLAESKGKSDVAKR